MTIGEIITKHYDRLHKGLRDFVAISQSRTEEDILQDVCLTALRKYKEKDIEEEEGLSYLLKTLGAEKHFQYNRKVNEILVFVDHPEGFCDVVIEPEDPEI